MKNLETFVKQENLFRKIFGLNQWNLDVLNQDAANDIFTTLDCKLSPENLTCDGERSPAQVKKFYKLYHGAANELKKLGWIPTVKTHDSNAEVSCLSCKFKGHLFELEETK